MTHTHAMVRVISKTVAIATVVPVLLIAAALAPSQAQAQSYIAYVTGIDQPEGCLRIRSAPTTASEIIGCAELGTKLRLTGTWSGNWAQISVPIYGWVYGPQISATYASSVVIAPTVTYDPYPDYWYSYPYVKRYWRHWPHWWKKRYWKKKHWKKRYWKKKAHHWRRWRGGHRVKHNVSPYKRAGVRSIRRGSRHYGISKSFSNSHRNFRKRGRSFGHAKNFSRSRLSRSVQSTNFRASNVGRSFRSSNFGGGSFHRSHGGHRAHSGHRGGRGRR